MTYFYFDQKMKEYEAFYQWDQALTYLEELYAKNKDNVLLNSLIGYSWFYLIEGPVVSKRYGNDKNVRALEVWKKYIDVGTQEARNDSFFNFIAGYTLSLHGFILNENYERNGILYMKRCVERSNNLMLRRLAENFLQNEESSTYTSITDGAEICNKLFSGDSLLEKYFNEMYAE